MKTCAQCRTFYDPHLRICPKDGALLSLPDSYRLVGNVLDGKYRIDALVGLGGFGAVYSAWHLGLDRQVAFNILQPNVAIQAPRVVGLSGSKLAASFLSRIERDEILAPGREFFYSLAPRLIRAGSPAVHQGGWR
jgi:serine/threonine protein kinase